MIMTGTKEAGDWLEIEVAYGSGGAIFRLDNFQFDPRIDPPERIFVGNYFDPHKYIKGMKSARPIVSSPEITPVMIRNLSSAGGGRLMAHFASGIQFESRVLFYEFSWWRESEDKDGNPIKLPPEIHFRSSGRFTTAGWLPAAATPSPAPRADTWRDRAPLF